jgi:hypothetical protein
MPRLPWIELNFPKPSTEPLATELHANLRTLRGESGPRLCHFFLEEKPLCVVGKDGPLKAALFFRGLQSRLGQRMITLESMKANLSGETKRNDPRAMTKEITFNVERDTESGWLTASWDASRRQGGITTQGKDLRELEQNVREAVNCHFQGKKVPSRIRLHFVDDPVLVSA